MFTLVKFFWFFGLAVLVPCAAFADPVTISAAASAVAAAAPSASVLANIGTVLSAGSAVLGGIGQIRAGQAANQNAKFQAQQLEQRAGQERASAQRVAVEERRRANIAQSNLQAAAAASGGGAADPTVLNLAGGLASQGNFNAMTALFEGEERARGSEFQARVTRAEGRAARRAGVVGGITTIAGGLGNVFMQRYGGQSSPSAVIGTAGVGGTRAPWQQPGMAVPSYAGGGTYG